MKTFLNTIIFLFLYCLQAYIFNTSILFNASILIITIILVNKQLNNKAEEKENEERLFLEEKYDNYITQLESYIRDEMDIYEKQKFEDEYLDDEEIAYYKKEKHNNK